MQDLGDLPGGEDGSFANALNSSNQIVGWSYGESGKRAVLWDSDGTLIDVGVLPGDNKSLASDINSSGQVIGESGNSSSVSIFIWSSADGMQDLDL